MNAWDCRYLGCSNNAYKGTNLCSYHRVVVQENGHHEPRGHLSDTERADIRKRMNRFERPLDIAKLYNITTKTVRKVMERK